ncbi:aminotransferase class V-fold PLP-dependent enzyme [Microbacterium esteraromaticum]|uniref:Aminotransferase class V-fold PLP-dependent enzyme n=1 Tax=Microbacterium esteraromaticum TaxID=57043 RepID=A0A7D7WE45_9MICO|nr:aminotransferase class V-fold PLP-dependent enzyme [Microbacterium esteraromaticum]QMU98598.1 aminotransferase class V-fold PLP-dependent enzyme [Microbacterium esteraromaticum]
MALTEQTDAASRPYVYFDSAAAAPPVPEAVDAAVSYLQRTAAEGPYVPSFRREVYERIEEVRAAVAGFLQAAPEEIAFTRNGTEAISLVARGIRWQRGDEVIVPDTEMLSNIAIWRMLEAEVGIRVVPFAADADGMLDPQRLAAAITPRTRLITFVALSNVTGAVQPVAEICRLAADAGVLTHVNAAQAIGMLPLGFSSWQADFISACTRKGLRGIEGSGVLAVRRQHVEAMTPALAGWWNAGLEGGGVTLPDTAKRFEAGSPNVPAILALGAAIEVAERIGIDSIHQQVRELTAAAVNGIRSIPGAAVYGPSDDDRLGIIPFNVAGVDPRALTDHLESRGIIIEAGHFMATPILNAYGISAMARASVHYFNSFDEIDRLVAEITAFAGKEES